MSNYFDQVASTWDQDPMKVERSKATAAQCKRFAERAGRHLLDFGGGTGLLSVFLAEAFGQITIADTSKEMLKLAQQKIQDAKIPNIRTQIIEQDIAELTEQYSAIVMLMTLHHIANTDGFLQSASNLLESGGLLMIADLYSENGLFHAHHQNFTGHNGFDTARLTRQLQQAGFSVVSVSNYFSIDKTIGSRESKNFTLFFLVAEKTA